MRKKYWLLICLIGLTLFTGILLAGRSSYPSVKNNDSTCCNLKTSKCPVQEKENQPGEMIIESLSHQFLLITPF